MPVLQMYPAGGSWQPFGSSGEVIIPPRAQIAASFLQGLTPVLYGARHPQYVTAATVTKTNSRVRAQAAVAMESVAVAFGNYYGNEEASPSFGMTVSATLEKYGAWTSGGNLATSGISDANETFFRLTFGGRDTVTIDPRAKALSDPITVPIPPGGFFYVRAYCTIPADAEVGITAGKDLAGAWNEAVEPVATVDKSGGGQLLSASTGVAPVAIVGVPAAGVTETRRVGIVGDSIGYGTGDANKVGYVEQALGSAGIPCYNTCRISGGVDQFMHPDKGLNRRELLWDATHIISEMGPNDIGNGVMPAATYLYRQLAYMAMWQAMATIGRASGTRPVWQCTVIPRMTGNGSGATPAPGTTGAYGRTVWNDWLRAGAPVDGGGAPTVPGAGTAFPYLTGVFDAADAVEADSSGVLTRNGTYFQNWTINTVEGLHPTTSGHLLLKAAVTTVSLT